MKFRLIWAIISIILEETVILLSALFILPQWNINITAIPLTLIMIFWLMLSIFFFVAGNRALDKKPVDGPDSIIGKKGMVVKALNQKGLVKINGELWGAESQENIETGAEIIVTGHNGIKLTVRRYKNNSQAN